MRVLLVTGTGGSGSTTVAAATAAGAAAAGHKTLVLSLAAPRSLGQVLGSPLGTTPTELDAGLFALHADVEDAYGRVWDTARRQLPTVLERAGAAAFTSATVPALPLADPLLTLLALQEQVCAAGWDVVVVDCPPAAATLRLLAVPEALRWYADRLFPLEHRALRAVRPLLARRCGPALPPEQVLTVLEQALVRLDGLRAVLTGAASSVRLVLTPEAGALAETRRATTALALAGHRLDALVVNRLLPASTDPFVAGWRASQQEQLAELRRLAGPVPVLELAHHGAGPVGQAALAALGCPLEMPGAEAAPDPSPTVSRTVDGFELSLPLPGASSDTLQLARSGDELVLTCAGSRRLLALPGALRRCTVTGARLSGGRLSVRFEPDPDLWPTAAGAGRAWA